MAFLALSSAFTSAAWVLCAWLKLRSSEKELAAFERAYERGGDAAVLALAAALRWRSRGEQ
ncbi:hypothetical protein [Saccharopolyspora sp. 6V]|uniref:hypothetical protein n=1 Tax=Saccharopolyspora sp. 6V TaxID=2877239 RepID=UPI001CD1FF43|nr:hypothetical protein [Saccharopolyspora sp. 6V]MCA1195123.1 hypothetical protein [Saccharopolyspora sp. 6V]